MTSLPRALCVLLMVHGCGTKTDPHTGTLTTTEPTTTSTSSETSSSTTSQPQSVITWTQTGANGCTDPGLRLTSPYQRHRTVSPEVMDRPWVQGGPIGIGDLNGDGVHDIVLPGPENGVIMYGTGTGTFRRTVLTDDFTLASAISLADYDVDGDLDIHVSRLHRPDRLLRNDGNEVFVDVAADLGLDGGDTYSVASAWADMDNDGDLDLVVAGYGHVDFETLDLSVTNPADPTRLYENLGNGQFTEVGAAMLPQAAHDGYTFIASWTELNGDNLPDLLLLNDYPQSGFHGGAALNMGTHFEWHTDIGLSTPRANMGLGIADLNADGIDDFIVTAWKRMQLLESSPFGVWLDSTNTNGLAVDEDIDQIVPWGVEIVDLDNDTDLDVVVGFGHTYVGLDADLANPLRQPDEVYRMTNGEFVPRGENLGMSSSLSTRGVAAADLNEDGWIDVVFRDVNGVADIHVSRCGAESWLLVRPRQNTDNPMAVGAEIIVTANGTTQRRKIRAGGTSYGSAVPFEAHFGLGEATTVDQVQITWPDGRVDTLTDVPSGQRIDVHREPPS